MSAEATEFLKKAIEAQHGATATFVCSVPIHESRKGMTVWNNAVQVFDLAGANGGATRAYAWSQGLADGQRQSVVVLHAGSVTGPREAVKGELQP